MNTNEKMEKATTETKEKVYQFILADGTIVSVTAENYLDAARKAKGIY